MSPLFGIGVTSSSFQSVGSSPVLIEMLNSFVTAGVMLVVVALSILAEIWSGPLDFVGSMLQMRSKTSSLVQSRSSGQFSLPGIENSLILMGDSGMVKFLAKHSKKNFINFKLFNIFPGGGGTP